MSLKLRGVCVVCAFMRVLCVRDMYIQSPEHTQLHIIMQTLMYMEGERELLNTIKTKQIKLRLGTSESIEAEPQEMLETPASEVKIALIIAQKELL